MTDLFGPAAGSETLAPGATVLRGFAAPVERALIEAVARIAAASPFRRMETPGGSMSVAMTNCGDVGWVADRRGYRYDERDPATGVSWPSMPPVFGDLAARAAASAGFDRFDPDACLINRYAVGAKLSIHQDRDERDFGHPIVSVSLGVAATFLFGGLKRTDRSARIRLDHGDVVAWGGPSRLRFHGVDTLRAGEHPLTGAFRYNLTFRKAL